MPYTYLIAGMPMQKSPKESLTGDFQGALNIDFKTASDWFTIQREFPYASGIYIPVDARVNRLFDGKTTVTVGDDFKRLLFRNPEDAPALGSMYQFDDNYWIVTNVEAIKSLATTCVVRRCNNMLRWKDFYSGQVYSQPCVIDYLIKETRDYSTGGSSLVQPSGFAEIIVQFNANTNKIRPSRRFLFGNVNNWMAYKVMGGGINNFDNRVTTDMVSVGLLRISTLANQANEQTDDFVNGIADALEYNYTISLNSNNLILAMGSSYTLVPTIEMNGGNISKNVLWTSSDTTKLVVDSNGTLTPVGVGGATVRCQLSDNPNVFDECIVNITSTTVNNYSITLTPNVDYVYEGEAQSFSVSLMLNGIQQPDVFVFALNTNGIPYTNFQYNVLSGNSFWINNLKRYEGNQLVVTATSGSHSMQIPIRLKGGW